MLYHIVSYYIVLYWASKDSKAVGLAPLLNGLGDSNRSRADCTYQPKSAPAEDVRSGTSGSPSHLRLQVSSSDLQVPDFKARFPYSAALQITNHDLCSCYWAVHDICVG